MGGGGGEREIRTALIPLSSFNTPRRLGVQSDKTEALQANRKHFIIIGPVSPSHQCDKNAGDKNAGEARGTINSPAQIHAGETPKYVVRAPGGTEEAVSRGGRLPCHTI
jgi:hypothetical protein